MLTTLGFIALTIGVVLVLIGYTIEPQATRPGWACIIIALILILVSALVSITTTHPGGDSTPTISRADTA